MSEKIQYSGRIVDVFGHTAVGKNTWTVVGLELQGSDYSQRGNCLRDTFSSSNTVASRALTEFVRGRDIFCPAPHVLSVVPYCLNYSHKGSKVDFVAGNAGSIEVRVFDFRQSLTRAMLDCKIHGEPTIIRGGFSEIDALNKVANDPSNYEQADLEKAASDLQLAAPLCGDYRHVRLPVPSNGTSLKPNNAVLDSYQEMRTYFAQPEDILPARSHFDDKKELFDKHKPRNSIGLFSQAVRNLMNQGAKF